MSVLTPEQHTVKYYSSRDADAPQISNVDGAIKTIIKACLVTGYGTKEGAGWLNLYEDDVRIVLRRPLRTGNPPDIKVSNFYGAHKIISQDNPFAVDDAAALASVSMITRDSKFKPEWHLVVSDFGFILCYQMGYSSSTYIKNNIMYVGSMSPFGNTEPPIFALKNSAATTDGTASYGVNELLGTGVSFVNMRTGVETTNKGYLSISLSLDSSFVQRLLIGDFFTPFYISLASYNSNELTEQIMINGRPMLRWFNKMDRNQYPRALFIPLDYWEL
ncbi:hypothetical protein [Psychrobacter aquimaris]|uniref:hypothetical protein n=1 Tax=Psychrobacter aquimaris TaxID=292733 RepID=UPI0018E01E85|nr:hypothetical protein [Psychrobacter aquimaris]